MIAIGFSGGKECLAVLIRGQPGMELRPILERYPGRIAVMGNISIDLLSRGSVEEVVAEVRRAFPETKIVIGGIEFVFVEGGEFRMGCFDMADALKNPEITSEALPVHSVSLDGFWLSKTEISRGQYGALSSSDAVYPVVNVEWDKARRFAEGLGRRVSGGAEYTLKTDLPTEAQWEYAARNRGNEIPYPGGWDTDCEDANFKVCRRPLMAAKSLDPSPLGLYHIVGNAREWCRDTYDATVYQKHEEQVSVKNPFVSYASGSNTYRVVRGGSFGDDKPGLKTYIRTQREASVPDSQTGFRVVIER